jgi:hypothetical protein
MKMKNETIKDFLLRSSVRGQPLYGKPKLVSLLSDSSHSCARILTVKVKKPEHEVFVLKQIKTLKTPLFAKYVVKKGEDAPVRVMGEDVSNIIEVTDEDPKEREKRAKITEKEVTTENELDYIVSTIPFEFSSKKLESCTDGAETLFECSEFLVEASVDYLIKTHVQEKIPFFLTSTDTWKSRHHGNLLLKNAGFDMNSHFAFYNLVDIQAIVLQAMYAIAWAQKLIHLKHHDLHCGNIFIHGKTKETQELHFPNGKVFVLPASSPKILIADYGLSSATDPTTLSRVTRADFHLMESSHSDSESEYSSDSESEEESDFESESETSESESESSTLDIPQLDESMDIDDEDVENDWGEWTHELNPNNSNRHMGYDIACFVSNLQEEATDRRHESLCWLNSILSEMHKMDREFELTSRGRPLTSSNFTIDQLIEQITLLPCFSISTRSKSKKL